MALGMQHPLNSRWLWQVFGKEASVEEREDLQGTTGAKTNRRTHMLAVAFLHTRGVKCSRRCARCTSTSLGRADSFIVWVWGYHCAMMSRGSTT